MKIYLKNPDTLKPRIKKLKQSLNEFEGLSPSLGLCRDLVAQSLNWDDWNDLHLGHQKPGSAYDSVLFTGRWYDGESNKQEASGNLSELISERFGDMITSLEATQSLALLVWPVSTSVFHDMLKQDKVDTILINDIPDYYLRDNILVDVETPVSYEKFIKAHTLPFISQHGGVIFCKPSEANSILQYFHDRGEEHGVIISQDYVYIIDDTMFFSTTTNHHLVWEHDEDNLMLNTFEHLLHQRTGGKMQPADRARFITWLSGKMQHGDTLTVASFGAHLCDKIHESSHDVINGVIESLSQEQFLGEPMSLTQLTTPPYPMVIISHSDDFLGHAVLSAFMHFISSAHERISKRECCATSQKPPSLLVLGLGDQITLSGFAASTIRSGAANWSVMVPQHSHRIAHHQYEGTEMPTFVANPMNIFRLKPDTFKQRLLRQPQAYWYCARNGRANLRTVMRCMGEYADKVDNLNKSVPPIPLKLGR
jgi:hypothetical protein